MKVFDSNRRVPLHRTLGNNALFYALALALAYGVKAHYSEASPEQLAWVLAPTAKLADILFGIPFEFETGTGYICRERGLIIAPACAGVNFMLMCFSVSVFPFVHRFGKSAAKLAWLSGSTAVAFVVSTSVNALRIFISMRLYEEQLFGAWIDPGRLHRIGGIAVYLGALCIVCFFVEKAADALGRLAFFEPPNLTSGPAPRKWRKTFFATAPVVVYVSMTIAVPLLNKGISTIDPVFAEHCAAVLSACLVVFAAFFLVQCVFLGRRRRR